jgi:hypothetical protein
MRKIALFLLLGLFLYFILHTLNFVALSAIHIPFSNNTHEKKIRAACKAKQPSNFLPHCFQLKKARKRNA